jgi:enoyl-CoA hydratase/carnithine racemase
MLLTGDMISAEDAQRIGLVNRVVAPDRARRSAEAGAANRLEIGADREDRQGGVLSSARDEPCRRLSLRLGVMVENMLARDAEEGIGAFIDKRTPTWEDR